MKRPARIVGIFLAVAGLGAMLAHQAGFFTAKIDPSAGARVGGEPVAETVTIAKVRETVFEEAAGTVRAKNETVISSRITASIAAVKVRAGDTVQRGDVLIELDDRELNARLGQRRQDVSAAEARLVQARRDHDRLVRIQKAEPSAVAGGDVDAAETKLRAAEAIMRRAQRAVEEASTASSYATITAPISGSVIDRYADPGDTATPGTALLRLYDPDHLRLEAHVRESLATRLTTGERLTVHIDAAGVDVVGTVEEIVPSADPGSRSFLVKVEVPLQDRLYPGMFGRLVIPSGETERFYVPETALLQVGQLAFVMVADERGAVRRYVRTGLARADAQIEILSGLLPGERVVLHP